MSETIEYVSGLVSRAQKAQREFQNATQQEVDSLCEKLAWALVQEDFVQYVAEQAVEVSRMGDVPSKYAKMMNKVRGGWYDMKDGKTVGVIEDDVEQGLIKLAKPVGVVGAMAPCTNCEATPAIKGLSTIKTRNAIILAPHPRTIGINKMVVDRMRAVLKKEGYNEDLIIHMDQVSMDNSQELMRQCNLILATGGDGLVKSAYSSGTPAYGVGAGNAVTIVDETANEKEVANKIMRSKTFDQATSCSAENSALIEESKYDAVLEALQEEGGYLASASEKEALQKTIWVDGHLSKDIVAQKAEVIAELAGISLPAGKTFFMVEETGIGANYPFSGEKLSVVVTVYRWSEFEAAINMVNQITAYSGAGHSCGIHTTQKERILELATKVNVSRIMVNQPQCLANSGAWTNAMPMTMTLGCGTWGGNISSDNITWRHLMNTTWVSSPIADQKPSDEELFSEKVRSEVLSF